MKDFILVQWHKHGLGIIWVGVYALLGLVMLFAMLWTF